MKHSDRVILKPFNIQVTLLGTGNTSNYSFPYVPGSSSFLGQILFYISYFIFGLTNLRLGLNQTISVEDFGVEVDQIKC